MLFILLLFITPIICYESCNFTRTPFYSSNLISSSVYPGKYILIASNEDIILYSYPSYTKLNFISLSYGITATVFLNQRKYFAIAKNYDIYFYSINSDSLSFEKKYSNVHSNTINKLSDTDSNYLITCSDDQTAKIIYYPSSSYYDSYNYQHSSVVRFCVKCSYSYVNNIATVTSDNIIHIWNGGSSPYKSFSSTIVGLQYSSIYIVTAESGGWIYWSSSQGLELYKQFVNKEIVAIHEIYSSAESTYYVVVLNNLGYISLYHHSEGMKKEFKLKYGSSSFSTIYLSKYSYTENIIILSRTHTFEVWNITKTTKIINNKCYTGCEDGKYLSIKYIFTLN